MTTLLQYDINGIENIWTGKVFISQDKLFKELENLLKYHKDNIQYSIKGDVKGTKNLSI